MITIIAIWRSMGVFRVTGTIIWLIWAFMGFNITSYPATNDYLPLAVGSFGVVMVIIMVTLTIQEYLAKLPKEPTHNEVQQAYRQKIISITKPPYRLSPPAYPKYVRGRKERTNVKEKD
jgi:hypothetical protein